MRLPPTEDKITLVAECDGLLYVDVAALRAFNCLGDVMCATLHDCTPVAHGVPGVLCGEKIDRETLVQLGHGGLCRGCPTCRYPVCDFGKF